MSLLIEDTEQSTLEETRDEDILRTSVKHPEFFSVLIDRYQDAFLRKALSIIKSREDAEDIVQEAFAKIYLNASRFVLQDGASFKSWGYKILLNAALTA